MKKILFVCTGNTCRSPFAEAYARKVLPAGWEAFSAGIYAADSMPASSDMLLAADARNLDLSLHQSGQLAPDDIKEAALILTMTQGHKSILLQQFPEHQEKLYTLNEYVDKKPFDIADPFGGSEEIYAQCADEIMDSIDRLAQKLSDC